MKTSCLSQTSCFLIMWTLHALQIWQMYNYSCAACRTVNSNTEERDEVVQQLLYFYLCIALSRTNVVFNAVLMKKELPQWWDDGVFMYHNHSTRVGPSWTTPSTEVKACKVSCVFWFKSAPKGIQSGAVTWSAKISQSSENHSKLGALQVRDWLRA